MKTLFAGLCVVALGAGRAWSETAAAKVKGTAEGSAISGTVAFADTKDGLKVTANLTGLPPGDHGFHIHEFGACDDAGKAAGSHYNPTKAKHGQLMKDGIKMSHGGDLGNITADKDGKAILDLTLPKLTVSGGKYSVAGRGVIVHEKADDFTQPAGNAGGRIGCGIIAITAPQ